MDYTNKILELTEKDKIIGQIYKITNTITEKYYIGQTRSHRMNKTKYRPFGIVGRLNDHISEAINNTQKNQSVYLNNSIRKYGKDVFVVELIETCKLEELNERETYYIKKLNALYPNGYNLREGNHMFSKGQVKINAELNEFKKKGREHGYKHKDETIEKMKKYYETVDKKIMEKKKKTMSDTVSEYFSDKRAQTLANSDLDIDENFAELIRPQKKDGEIVCHTIRQKRKKYISLTKGKYTPEESYNILYDALKKAYEIRKNNIETTAKETTAKETTAKETTAKETTAKETTAKETTAKLTK